MSSVFKKTEISEQEQREITSLVFVKLAENGEFDEAVIAEHPKLFIEWSENWTGKAGNIVSENGNLYKSIHDITDKSQNTRPSETPSMWTQIGNPQDEYPEWYQPIGSHDAYSLGDKVSHNDKHWTSTINNNVWEPGVYGWEEVTE